MSTPSSPTSFLDVSALLRPGVYILKHGDRVTYVGKASRCILAAIANHYIRNRAHLPAFLASSFPAIHFDGLEIIPCDAARAIDIAAALIAHYRPSHNRSKPAPATPSPAPVPATTSPSQVRRL